MLSMKPIDLMPKETARAISWVLTDIDDTMTENGKLVPEAYAALCELAASGLRVVAVTGRSAGWGEVHLQEWPIAAAITENGAVSYYRKLDGAVETLAHPTAVRNTDAALVRASEAAYAAVPRAIPARDNHFRLYDYAIDHAEYVEPPLSEAEVAAIVNAFEREGCVAKPSSIHVNCWIGNFNKREAALALLPFLSRELGLPEYDDARDRSSVLYVGDAPNDEVMFAHFPNACAVANIDRWADGIGSLPAWVSRGRFGMGFAEIARHVIAARG
jgi:HAD superfamily hydrolase (TIGR01484 family)